MILKDKNILLLITGSIAAYKSAELVRHLVKAGAQVRVAMTPSAEKFITPLTLQTLSGNPVMTDFFDLNQEAEIGHIQLADTADIVLVAPATADFIAKAAHGHADSLVSAIVLATKALIIIAPAMNVNMWENPITMQNVEILKSHEVRFIEPQCGELACGWEGLGRLADLEQIVFALESTLTKPSLTGAHVVVTAGPTSEPLDPVRFLSNRSTGKMGFAVAKIAALRGAKVSLITGPTSLVPPPGVETHRVGTAREMQEKLLQILLEPKATVRVQYVFMAAAVSDFRPQEFSSKKLKLKKDAHVELRLTPNPDILFELGQKRHSLEKQTGVPLKLIGFAAESGDDTELKKHAREKLKQKNLDLIVGNLVTDSFESDTNRIWLLDTDGNEECVETSHKEIIAERIIQRTMGSTTADRALFS